MRAAGEAAVIAHKPDRVGERPLPTSRYESAESFVVPRGAVYVAARSGEERSQHAIALQQRSPGASFLEIVEQTRSSFRLEGTEGEVELRSRVQLGEFWASISAASACFIDITGLTHSVWSALIGAGLRAGAMVEAVYVEPMRYRENAIADPSRDLFDLTVGFEGLAPLPGLARLAEPHESAFWFVPLLGFEGRRFSYMKEQVAPIGRHTVPVIGVPGFQPEFVGFAYHGNQEPLREDEVWQNIAYATANCPFSLFYLLEDLCDRLQSDFLKIATIGTKPHSLGAVLFALTNPDRVEILYDHPQRKSERTTGKARLLVYHLHAFEPVVSAALTGEAAP
jgi:hypothetical protein